jgi:prevent-host-death family protein
MYTVHQAKTNLSKLLRKVENGEEVIIARGKEPVAKIVPFQRGGRSAFPAASKGKSGMRQTRLLP